MEPGWPAGRQVHFSVPVEAYPSTNTQALPKHIFGAGQFALLHPTLQTPSAVHLASPPQRVPMGARVNDGASGVPVHTGLIRQGFSAGVSVGSSTDVVPPLPLQTIF